MRLIILYHEWSGDERWKDILKSWRLYWRNQYLCGICGLQFKIRRLGQLYCVCCIMKLENVAIVNALQLAAPVLIHFNYDTHAMVQVGQPVHSFLQLFYCWYVMLHCDLWPLTLNIRNILPVTCWNSAPNFSEIEQSRWVIVISVFELMILNMFNVFSYAVV